MSPFVESGTPMSWARIERVKAGLPYFARSLFVDRVIMSFGVDKEPVHVENTSSDSGDAGG